MTNPSVKAGQTVTMGVGYAVRAFEISGDEAISSNPSEFDINGREPRLIPVTAGQNHAALTDATDDLLYIRIEHDGKTFAARLLADTFAPA